MQVSRQQPVPVIWKGLEIDHGFRADLIVENKVLIEIKSVQKILRVHKK
ncbi:MAG: GxxExxY protein, partial [Balneolales bacterium]|nr:GxxExxY protein [Balneolales bacterium]